MTPYTTPEERRGVRQRGWREGYENHDICAFWGRVGIWHCLGWDWDGALQFEWVISPFWSSVRLDFSAYLFIGGLSDG
jgi:hypothetical protein